VNDSRAPHCTAANDPWLREAVGAYLLGALDPAESDRVATHLAGCASCRAEYGELAELLPLLASVTEAEAVNGPVMPQPAVLGRVLATTSLHSSDVDASSNGHRHAHAKGTGPSFRAPRWRVARTSIRTRVALGAAVAVVVAGGTVAGKMMSSSGSNLPAGSWTASATAAAYAIHATVQVTPATHGSKIQLKMDDVPAGYSCSMVVVGENGEHQTTGTWTANTEGSFAVPGWSAMTPNLIKSVEIDLPNGSTLLTLNHPQT
jgi:hypothetical protein